MGPGMGAPWAPGQMAEVSPVCWSAAHTLPGLHFPFIFPSRAWKVGVLKQVGEILITTRSPPVRTVPKAFSQPYPL